METTQKKLMVLSKIAKKLNENNITWAIGASMLLYFKDITNKFNDIDIVVAEDDVESLNEIVLTFGDILPPNPNLKYRTRHFLEFKVDGVDIDVMAGFIIVKKNQEYYFPLQHGDINDYTEINGVKIPLQSISEWRKYYELMGRTEKVEMIDSKLYN